MTPFLALPGIGLFLVLKKRGQIGIWEAVLTIVEVLYLIIVARLFPNLYYGIAVAHVSFVSTILWYAVIASEIREPDNSYGSGGYSGAPILASLCVPVIVFQIAASGSQIFENVSMEPCAGLMRSWLVMAIFVSTVLLLGRQRYWRELSWFAGTLSNGNKETTGWYMTVGFVASMIYPFFVTGFPNPIRILFCMLH